MCGLALSVPGDAADPTPLVFAVCHAARHVHATTWPERERVDVSLTDKLGEEGMGGGEGRKEREEQRERVGGDKTRELG